MLVNVSIHDFSPLFRDLEYLFAGMKKAGADGVELLVGVKSRSRLAKLRALSVKYDLPIITIHQPIWSGMGWWLDEGFVRFAKELKVKYIVLHPREGCELDSPQMNRYLSSFAGWQKKYDVPICLENMPATATLPFFEKVLTFAPSQAKLPLIAAAAKKYGLFTTYDTSHTMYETPQTHSDFLEMFPTVRIIHLSSFLPKVEHLPLDQGRLDAQSFIKFLVKENYAGVLTLELFYPSLFTGWRYDFDAVARSIRKVREAAN